MKIHPTNLLLLPFRILNMSQISENVIDLRKITKIVFSHFTTRISLKLGIRQTMAFKV